MKCFCNYIYAKRGLSSFFIRILKYLLDMKTSFKENLRDLLDYNDMTVKELAFKTGISKRSIENYLGARSSIPPADYACKIAEALNTTVEYLVNGNNTKKEVFPDKIIRLMRKFQTLSINHQNAIEEIIESMPQNK